MRPELRGGRVLLAVERTAFPSRTTSRSAGTLLAGLGTCKEGSLNGAGVSNTFGWSVVRKKPGEGDI